MTKVFAHLLVPAFSAEQLSLAEVCAVELSNGFDYWTGMIQLTGHPHSINGVINDLPQHHQQVVRLERGTALNSPFEVQHQLSALPAIGKRAVLGEVHHRYLRLQHWQRLVQEDVPTSLFGPLKCYGLLKECLCRLMKR